MHEEFIAQAIHDETMVVLSSSFDRLIENIRIYENTIYWSTILNYIPYVNIINRDPLASWVISNFLDDKIRIKKFIIFDKYFMLRNIHLYEPYLIKWIEYICGIYLSLSREISYIKEVLYERKNLPDYIINRIPNAPVSDKESFIRYVFADVFEALASYDYSTYIEMCLSLQKY